MKQDWEVLPFLIYQCSSATRSARILSVGWRPRTRLLFPLPPLLDEQSGNDFLLGRPKESFVCSGSSNRDVNPPPPGR